MRKLLVLGTILFKGQGADNDTVVEIDRFALVDEGDMDEFTENYLDSGGDSYSTVERDLTYLNVEDAISKLEELESRLIKDINEAMISSHKDDLSRSLDLVTDAIIKLS